MFPEKDILLSSESESKFFFGLSYKIPIMARGWESKSVEQQQAEMLERGNPARPQLSPEQRERDRKRQGLLLSRSHLSRQLETAQKPRHRQMLVDAIAELDRQLSSLE
jgi:hypothetical protein